MQLEEKIAIITGSGRGIGGATAIEFAAQGAKVVCTARSKEQIEQTVEIIKQQGGEAIAINCDVTDRSQVDQMVEKTIEHFGRVDILFNNAGSFSSIGAVWEVDPDNWWTDVKVNLRGSMLCCRAVLKYMLKQDSGVIINMNGGGSTVPLAGGSGYGCSKTALMRLTDTLASELEKINSNVIVLAMGPGFVKTEMSLLQLSQQGRKWIPQTEERLARGYDGSPKDCAIATIKLLRIINKNLSGRIFDVENDFEKIARDSAKIKEQDLYTLRLKKNH